MISDALFDAIAEIDRYLTDPAFASAYDDPDLRAEIDRVRAEMDGLRARLDAPPACRHCRALLGADHAPTCAVLHSYPMETKVAARWCGKWAPTK